METNRLRFTLPLAAFLAVTGCGSGNSAAVGSNPDVAPTKAVVGSMSSMKVRDKPADSKAKPPGQAPTKP